MQLFVLLLAHFADVNSCNFHKFAPIPPQFVVTGNIKEDQDFQISFTSLPKKWFKTTIVLFLYLSGEII